MKFKDSDSGSDNIVPTYSLYDDKDTDDRDDENDDALSLCNLSMYCDAEDKSFDRASSSSSSSSSSDHRDDDDDADFFGFSSVEDFGSSAPHEIVFCGKLISHVEPTLPSLLSEAAKTKSSLQTSHNKTDPRPFKRPGRLSIREAKRKWYFYAFGLARFPTEMALSEMKTRQNRSRRPRSNMFGSSNGSGGGEIVSGGGDGRRSGRAGKGWSGLLKALGLSSRSHQQHASAVVKASFGCIPRV